MNRRNSQHTASPRHPPPNGLPVRTFQELVVATDGSVHPLTSLDHEQALQAAYRQMLSVIAQQYDTFYRNQCTFQLEDQRQRHILEMDELIGKHMTELQRLKEDARRRDSVRVAMENDMLETLDAERQKADLIVQELEEVKLEVERGRNVSHGLQKSLHAKVVEWEMAVDDVTRLNSELESEKEHVEALTRSTIESKGRVNRFEKQAEEADRAKDEIERQLTSCKKEKKVVEADRQQLQADLDTCQIARGEEQERVRALKSNLEDGVLEMEKLRKDYKKAYCEQKAKIDKQHDEIETLKKENVELDKKRRQFRDNAIYEQNQLLKLREDRQTDLEVVNWRAARMAGRIVNYRVAIRFYALLSRGRARDLEDMQHCLNGVMVSLGRFSRPAELVIDANTLLQLPSPTSEGFLDVKTEEAKEINNPKSDVASSTQYETTTSRSQDVFMMAPPDPLATKDSSATTMTEEASHPRTLDGDDFVTADPATPQEKQHARSISSSPVRGQDEITGTSSIQQTQSSLPSSNDCVSVTPVAGSKIQVTPQGPSEVESTVPCNAPTEPKLDRQRKLAIVENTRSPLSLKRKRDDQDSIQYAQERSLPPRRRTWDTYRPQY